MNVPRRTYIAGMLSAFGLLAWFTTIGTMAQLASTRRFFNPLAHLRLALWATTLAFELLPTMLVSCFRGHHPSSLVDPLGYELWLRELELAAVPGVRTFTELDRAVVT